MKLLFDQNLSHRLARMLVDVYPDCVHVRDVGLKTATDTVIWEYARHQNYMIVSKDSDFHQRSFVLGHPPKVVWVRLGNCATGVIETLLRNHVDDIQAFEQDTTATFLILS